MGRDLRRGIPAEDAWTSAPGSNPGRPGRPLTFRGGNGSHTTHPELLIRTAASARSESARNRITPGSISRVSFPRGGSAPPPTQFTAGRRQGPTTGPFGSRNPGLARPLPLAGHGSFPSEGGSPRRPESHRADRASSGGGRHRETEAGVTRSGPPRLAPNTCRRRQRCGRLASQARRSTPGREPGRSLTSSPTKSGDFPRSFFGWSASRGVAPTPRIRQSRAGVPIRLLAGFDGPHGQSKAPSGADRRRAGAVRPTRAAPPGLWPWEGSGSPRSVAGAVRCCLQNDVMKLSSFTSDSSPVRGKP